MSARRDLPVATMVWQTHASAWVMTTVCKATFGLQEGKLALAAAQEGVYEHDNHWNDDRERSLSTASDLAPMKPRCDVLLVGHTFAPEGKAVRALSARLVVASIDKSIEAHVDRAIAPDAVVYEGTPFSRMRLVYERAAGGPGTWNPVGMRSGTRDAYGRVVLPNITLPGRSATQKIEPAGFGPIAPSWPLRSERAGYHAPLFQTPRWSERPLPADIDASYFNVAPLDQQPASIADDAEMILEHLHPRFALLRARLPGLRPRVLFERGGAQRPLELRADTLWFDTDRAICTLSWRGEIPLEHAGERPVIHVELDAPTSGQARATDAVRRGVLPFAAMAARAPQPFAAPPQAPALAPAPAPALAPAPPPPSSAGLRFPRAAPAAPPAIVHHSSAAVLGGLAGASNAAADPRARDRAGPAAKRYEGDLLQLLWFDPEIAGRLQRRAEWKKIVDELVRTERDPEIDQPGLDEEAPAIEDRREVFEVLSRGTATGEDGVQDALVVAIRSDGRFEPQLLLVAGEARFDFDEVERLKATIAAAIPFAVADGPLALAVEDASTFLATPLLVTSPDVLEGMTKRLMAAFVDGPRAVGPTYLEEQTERALLERRAYQKRDVFGAKHLRASLFFPGATSGHPTYLAEPLVKKLPIFRRLPVKMLVETHFQADQYEVHDAAFRVVALARVIDTRTANTGQR